MSDSSGLGQMIISYHVRIEKEASEASYLAFLLLHWRWVVIMRKMLG